MSAVHAFMQGSPSSIPGFRSKENSTYRALPGHQGVQIGAWKFGGVEAGDWERQGKWPHTPTQLRQGGYPKGANALAWVLTGPREG